ncbi:small, acid-soluble spore protein, alpha/beta type [Haloimpatiens sp. FM7330]|uniref:small, acid-soluble spore protein, alpha/beta type n=1 Tax=Haloimpatiens sp. FM7330 TaxID=3298610 RepID=UPI00362C7619
MINYTNNDIGSKNQKEVPDAKGVLRQFKYEVANEIGVHVPEDGYWGNMTSKDCGSVGGYMVKKMIEMAERDLMNGQK